MDYRTHFGFETTDFTCNTHDQFFDENLVGSDLFLKVSIGLRH